MRVLVTGGAGFIGSHVCERLLALKNKVVAYDNLSTGFLRFLKKAKEHPSFTLVEGDLLDRNKLDRAMAGIDFVYHLAANADVRFGTDHPDRDMQQNTTATFHVLEAMRKNGVRRIVFASTGSVYGEANVIPTPENASFPVQTSLYGASKLAAEGLIAAYCEGFGFQSWIFRFVSVLGERYTHGHVFDFYKQLLENPNELRVLGDGTQRKSYMEVHDCIDGILLAIEKAKAKVNIFNLGTDHFVQVTDSIRLITEHLGLSPKLSFAGGNRGWIGDNPFIFLDTAKIRTLGWKPRFTIQEGIITTLRWLQANQWVLTERK